MKTYTINDHSVTIDDFAQYGITEVIADAFFASLQDHIAYVTEAGRKLGLPDDQLRQHDKSKLTLAEFPHYARNFFGDKGDPDGYAAAWLHHIHHNPHHWPHWIFADGFTPRGSSVEAGVVAMPTHYATEMVADWLGASMAYTGSWDMTAWLEQSMARIRVHSQTATLVRSLLRDLGYAEAVVTLPFANGA